MLVIQHYMFASIFAVVIGLTLLGWHGKEPQEHG
jgi:sugar phosphate permease